MDVAGAVASRLSWLLRVGLRLARGCGWEVEVFCAGDVEADGCGAGGGAGEGEAGQGGHDVGFGGFGLLGVGEEEADAGAVDAGGVGVWGLRDDGAGFAGGGDVSDGAEFEGDAADVDGGGALGLADEVGDGDVLGAETFGDADGPLATDDRTGGGGLGEDAAGGCGGGVEAVFEVEAEAEGAGLFAGVGDGEAGEVGDLDLAAVDGETHGDEGGDERDHEHGQGSEDDVEEAVDAGESQLHGQDQDTGCGGVWSCVLMSRRRDSGDSERLKSCGFLLEGGYC